MNETEIRLTTRQRHIIHLIGQGLTSREIAEQLGLSVRTVENHRARICNRLELSGQNALLRAILEGHLEFLK